MKINWRNLNKKLTFVVIPDASRSVLRIRIPKPILFIIPMIAVLLIMALTMLYILHMQTLVTKTNLQLKLSHIENEYLHTVANKDQVIEELQNDVIALSNQANEIKAKMEELKVLENEIKEIGTPIAAKEKPVVIASESVSEVFESVSDPNPLMNNKIKQIQDKATGGEYVSVDNESIQKLAVDTESGFVEISSEMNILLEGLSQAKEHIMQHKELLRITPSIWPTTSYRITSTFGYRKDPFTGKPSRHTGIDIGGKTKDPVFSTADGTVEYAGYDSAHGNNVIINHSNGIRTRYMHLKKNLVNRGESVVKGQEIGLLGSTGRSTGPHLHYEVIKNGIRIDPRPYMDIVRKDDK